MTLATTNNNSREELGGKTFFEVTNGSYGLTKYMKLTRAKRLEGYQFRFRYIYFIDKKSRKKLTAPEIPFSRIDELNAGYVSR